MTLNQRIAALIKLGRLILEDNLVFTSVIHDAYVHNNWFTPENTQKALRAIATQFLEEDKLTNWISSYPPGSNSMNIGLILAGNIPLVGFHDILSTFICGHKCKIKLSDKDKKLIPALLNQLYQIDSETRSYFSIVDRMENYDAIIATGSNNSAVHFEYYFKHVPHIIRRNRNAVGILHGEESRADLITLGKDIFDYFGLGCRNVSKLYVPKDFDLTTIMEALHEYNDLVLHNKYKNNFDYNYAIYLLNQEDFLMNGCILLKETNDIVSRIAMLGYEYYESIPELVKEINSRQNEIQCVVSTMEVEGLNTIGLGESQHPGLADYADGVDTVNFLINL